MFISAAVTQLTPGSCHARCRPARGAPESSCPRGTSGICPPFGPSSVEDLQPSRLLPLSLQMSDCAGRAGKCDILGRLGWFPVRIPLPAGNFRFGSDIYGVSERFRSILAAFRKEIELTCAGTFAYFASIGIYGR